MGRKPRIHQPGGFYHAILRGNDRQPLFFADVDRYRWEKLLANALDRYDAELHCYCWMTNHIHLLIQVNAAPLGRIIQYAATLYARQTNYQQGKTGHLFERRHRALLITDDRYLMGLMRYIHNNPLKAEMVADINAYPWSSHPCYLGERECSWLTTARLLALFGSSSSRARHRYAHFMQQSETEDIEIYRTGNEDDQRLLGELPEEIKQTENANCAALPTPEYTLDQIIQHHCETNRISPNEIFGSSKARHLSQARTNIIMEAVTSQTATVAEIARRLNRSEAAICQAIRRRHEKSLKS